MNSPLRLTNSRVPSTDRPASSAPGTPCVPVDIGPSSDSSGGSGASSARRSAITRWAARSAAVSGNGRSWPNREVGAVNREDRAAGLARGGDGAKPATPAGSARGSCRHGHRTRGIRGRAAGVALVQVFAHDEGGGRRPVEQSSRSISRSSSSSFRHHFQLLEPSPGSARDRVLRPAPASCGRACRPERVISRSTVRRRAPTRPPLSARAPPPLRGLARIDAPLHQPSS